ncbi:MAG TPA: threonine--tRNA ligase [Candidatus Protoclostridium stercorigallinarum]|uniref:Threonine--tRNA ligase n=1 Tax=Candidatus Protoclostridium stercorigallinarum TaxID=2838741 RepID=A0A9D1TRJ4_9FIRM|nr:threonine--tRNA ligase [Candidatus Protoclostridium stercorigallinarum]
MTVTLKDGSTIQAEQGEKIIDVTKRISEGLARNALIARMNGKLVDLTRTIDEDCTLEILTFKDEEGRNAYRHTCAHILAQAVKNLYPDAKLAIGPAIKTGFYYDFDLPSPITMDDLPRIEKEMESIIKADLPIERSVVTRKQALTRMRGFDEIYKLQLIEDLPRGSEITLYTQGNFVDLCAGPHLMSTGKVKCFKLTQITGAYWRGNEQNKMLTRIYGTAFEKKSELTEYLNAVEEAKKRDHNKLGRELGIFMTDELVGQGLPLLMPNGAKLFQILQRFVENEEERRGYMLTKTPYMAKSDLYKISGHWDHYKDGMFLLGDEAMDDEVMALRPMTCPFQYLIYKNGIKSYRDLPCRYNETSTLFRNESSGEMHGLTRVRQFTLSEAHIICAPEHVEEEFKNVFELILYMEKCLGISDEISYRFSKWDPKKKTKYINNPKAWTETQTLMKKILDDLGINYVEADGEAAFYGPKLDLQARNVWGKEDTIITIQLDFAAAERFDMFYVAEDGTRKRPMVIHRSSIGSYERTIAMLIEKYAGAFPVWMSPNQVKVLALTDRTADKCKEIVSRLHALGIRATSDLRNEKIGFKIREAQLEKTPYMLIIGDREAEEDKVSVRARKAGDLGTMTFDEFATRIKNEIETFSLEN